MVSKTDPKAKQKNTNKKYAAYVQEKKEITVPMLQKEFKLHYASARAAVAQFVEDNVLKYSGGLVFTYVENSLSEAVDKSAEETTKVKRIFSEGYDEFKNLVIQKARQATDEDLLLYSVEPAVPSYLKMILKLKHLNKDQLLKLSKITMLPEYFINGVRYFLDNKSVPPSEILASRQLISGEVWLDILGSLLYCNDFKTEFDWNFCISEEISTVEQLGISPDYLAMMRQIGLFINCLTIDDILEIRKKLFL